ncbi:hypothetical protein ACIBSV_49295 [Embleya sp. NPDC050154]|uniref:hypothetical protein n=1 Tax=Embleya sp. NPDC050154 TaxID=3363988 RepID=UPI0037951B99
MRDHLNGLYVRAANHPTPGVGRAYTPEQVHTWLGVLARYLDTNATTGPVVGGRRLSGTDLVLHELWPLAGSHRARTAHALLFTAASIAMGAAATIGSLLLDTSGTLLPPLWMVTTLSAALSTMVGLLGIRTETWPSPTRLAPDKLRTPQGRLGAGLGLKVGLVFGFATTVWGGLAFELTTGLTLGLAVGLMAGLVLGAVAGGAEDGSFSVKDPRDLTRADLTAGLGLALTGSLAGGLLMGILGKLSDGNTLGLKVGLLAGLAFGPAFGLALATAWLRYIAFLACTRRGPHQLPWRLGRFLNGATNAGILRITGTAYQFRHRELQDWLAHNPTP